MNGKTSQSGTKFQILTDKGPVSRIYKELSKLKEKTSIFQRGKKILKQTVHQRRSLGGKCAHKKCEHKRLMTSLVFREIKSNHSEIPLYILPGMAENKETDSIRVLQRNRTNGIYTLIYVKEGLL